MPNYILGSGDLYLLLGDTIPADAQLEVAENKIGNISGGASLSYSNETYDVTNDYNQVLGRMITKEEVTFKSGILTWDLPVLEKLISSSALSTVEGKDVLKIGGKSSTGMKPVVIRFVHTMTNDKKLRVTLVGNNSSGFELVFDKSKETIIDAEFKALSQEDGTLVIVEMEK